MGGIFGFEKILRDVCKKVFIKHPFEPLIRRGGTKTQRVLYIFLDPWCFCVLQYVLRENLKQERFSRGLNNYYSLTISFLTNSKAKARQAGKN